ncbi:TonB-dependent receptor [Flavitalea flava]
MRTLSFPVNTLIPFLFGMIFISCGYTAAAQQKKSPLISGRFQQLKIGEFVRVIEGQTGLRFYYDPAQFDSLLITVNVQEQPLDAVLESLFRNTTYHFAIDGNGHVFLSKGWIIQAELPEGFFGKGLAARDSALARGTQVSFGADKKGRQSTIIENKLYDIGIRTNTLASGNAIVNGYVRNTRTGEPVAGAAITADGPVMTRLSDQYGYFSLTLPRGHHNLTVQAIGMRDTKFQVMLYSDGKLDMDLREQVITLREVVVSSQKTANINRVQLGVEKLSIQTIKQVPSVMGEADILRVVLTLPGVKTVGEASTGLNVRGGAADQNLILFNDATIYNPSHFFGMFSAFNPDVVKDIELYKSSIPAKFGGRVSSVLDITSREGNKKEFHGTAGVGFLTSRLTLEGPLAKDKTSFILGGRTTYANWLLNLLPDEYKHSRGSFNDLNLSISHEINRKNNLYFTGYLSNDKFNLNNDTTYKYGNQNISVKWKHIFSNKLNSVYTVGFDKYRYNIGSDANPVNAYRLAFDISQANGKADFVWYLHSKHTLDFGLSAIRYTLHPGSYQPDKGQSLVVPDVVPAEQALESAVYLSDRFTVSPKLSIVAGLRYSLYNYLGPHSVNIYAPGLPVTGSNLVDTRDYASGKVINTYKGPEYRLSMRYALTTSFSVKAGYNSLRQYTHVLSNTTAMAPTDIWKLSDPNIKPQLGDQVSLGFYKNLKSNTIETSIEVYYKRLKNYLDYRSGATLILNHHIETDVLNSGGKAYGVELMVKKSAGKLNGWISYTWSRTLLRTTDPNAGEKVNRGEYYPADFDIPNDVTMVGNLKINHRFSLSLNMLYYTGRPITLPIARYYYGGSQRVLYSDRNQYRIPDYFRTDFSMNIDGNHKVHQFTHNSWTIGVYNLTGRKNPYNVYFISENGGVNGYKLSIFGSAIPFVNYNIRF